MMMLLCVVSKTAYCKSIDIILGSLVDLRFIEELISGLAIRRRQSDVDGSTSSSPMPENGHKEPYRVCYYTTWARYRRSPANMQPQDVNENLCSHLIMAFAWITYDGRLALHSEWEDQYVVKGLLSKATLNPELKVRGSLKGVPEGPSQKNWYLSDPSGCGRPKLWFRAISKGDCQR